MNISDCRKPTRRRTPEPDREDLLAEATALRRRAELRVPGEPEHVVAGFRETGGLSMYFGGDPVYHVDAAGRLRRAFVDGDLYRTQGTTLARLTRVRTPDATELRRHDLDEDELAQFLRATRARLDAFREALRSGAVTVVRQIPGEDAALLDDLQAALDRVLTTEEPLAGPVPGRR